MFVDLNRAAVAFQFLFQISLPSVDCEERDDREEEQLFRLLLGEILGGLQPSKELRRKLMPVFQSALHNPRSHHELVRELRHTFLGERENVLSLISISIRLLSSEEGAMTSRDRNILKDLFLNLDLTSEEVLQFSEVEQGIIEICLYSELQAPSSLSQRDAELHAAYILLGCNEGDSSSEIKAAYRRLVKIHHPDSEVARSRSAKEFVRVQQAYELIMNRMLK